MSTHNIGFNGEIRSTYTFGFVCFVLRFYDPFTNDWGHVEQTTLLCRLSPLSG